MSEFLDSLSENDLRKVVRDLASRVTALEQRTIQVDALDELGTDDLGDMQAGSASGWQLQEGELASADGTAKINSDVPYIALGATGHKNGIGLWVGRAGEDWKLHLGDPSGKYISFDGADIEAIGLKVVTAMISELVTVGADNPKLIFDGVNKLIKSSDFLEGVRGLLLRANGNTEFYNTVIRGELRSTMLAIGERLITAGSQEITKSGGKLRADVVTAESPATNFIEIEDPPGGHMAVFEVNDILRLKTATQSNWLKVLGVSDQTTHYRYECELKDGSPATFAAGLAVVDYGQAGDGYLLLTADEAGGPYYSVRMHTGQPWTDAREVIRLGSLDGIDGYEGLIGLLGRDVDGNVQFGLDDQGRGVIAGGIGTLDSDGFGIEAGTALSNIRSYKFHDKDTDETIGGVYAVQPQYTNHNRVGIFAYKSNSGENERKAVLSMTVDDIGFYVTKGRALAYEVNFNDYLSLNRPRMLYGSEIVGKQFDHKLIYDRVAYPGGANIKSLKYDNYYNYGDGMTTVVLPGPLHGYSKTFVLSSGGPHIALTAVTRCSMQNGSQWLYNIVGKTPDNQFYTTGGDLCPGMLVGGTGIPASTIVLEIVRDPDGYDPEAPPMVPSPQFWKIKLSNAATITSRETVTFKVEGGKNYDVGLYYDTYFDTLPAEGHFRENVKTRHILQPWSTNTARSVPLNSINQVMFFEAYSGELCSYVGTIRTTIDGETEDTLSKRLIWNYYNQQELPLKYYNGTSHTYTTGSWRAWRNLATARVEFVVGLDSLLKAFVSSNIGATGTSQRGFVGLGVDTTTANSIDFATGVNAGSYYMTMGGLSLPHTEPIAAGYHYVSLNQLGYDPSATYNHGLLTAMVWG